MLRNPQVGEYVLRLRGSGGDLSLLANDFNDRVQHERREEWRVSFYKMYRMYKCIELYS